MKIDEWLARSAERQPGWVYDGDPDVEFTGFQLPGVKKSDGSTFFDRSRFYVLMDKSWGKYHLRLSPQFKKTIDEVFDLVAQLGIDNVLAPMELRGSAALQGKNVIFAENSRAFVTEAGLTARREAQAAGRPLVGVTGAAGKSTLTAMISQAIRLSRPGSSVLHPPPNFNLFDRLTAELTQMWEADFGVLEMSNVVCEQASKRKKPLSPDVAVVTNISHAHVERYGTVEEVAKVKSLIFESPYEGARAVINPDTQHADILIGKAEREGWEICLYGEAEEADFRLLDYAEDTNNVIAATPWGEVEYSLGAAGRHMALNSLATLAVLDSIGLARSSESLKGIEGFEALPGRGKETEFRVADGTIWAIDEAYNANPESMGHFIRTVGAKQLGGERRRRILVLGDMLELGDDSKRLHRDLQGALAAAAVDHVYLHGELMRELAAEVEGPEVTHIAELEELESVLRGEVRAGDIVGFKGSHGTGLHRVLSNLSETWKGAA